jgi:hypothetical protein
MKTLPAKNYTALSTLNQLCLPMDSGVLIPPDDPVRLPVFVLKRLDLNPLYEAYSAYCERRRREQAGREREAAERGAGKLIEAEGKDTQPGRRVEKKKDGWPPCDIVVLFSIVLYGAMSISIPAAPWPKRADRTSTLCGCYKAIRRRPTG